MKRNSNRQSGFTLIELMMVVAIIAILVSVTVPGLLRSRMAANESAAIAAIRQLITSEVGFQTAVHRDSLGDGVGDFGSLNELFDPSGDGQPGYIDDALASGFRQGYEFVLVPQDGVLGVPPSYTLNANPMAPGQTGSRYFYTDQNGSIRSSLTGPAGPDDYFIQ